ncbi:GNAT family N-acetyltransferase [Ketobacter sp. MCCC 1A13808]|nr:GNAT family N-acetyltransferase [Ketobacter sp. MCCC 1A13808]
MAVSGYGLPEISHRCLTIDTELAIQTAFRVPFAPCVEIAWRLSKPFWGNGYASEAAAASLVYASDLLKLAQVVSFTATINTRSQAGMCTERFEFNHPDIAPDHILCRHILYKMDFD